MTERQRTWLLAAIALVMGGGGLLIGGSGIIGVFDALGRHASVIAFQAFDATAFFAGLGILLIGIVALLPRPAAAFGKSRRAPERPGLGLPLMLLAAGCIVLSPFAGSLGRLLVDSAASSRGYARCPPPAQPRRQPDRWAVAAPNGELTSCPA